MLYSKIWELFTSNISTVLYIIYERKIITKINNLFVVIYLHFNFLNVIDLKKANPMYDLHSDLFYLMKRKLLSYICVI